MTHLWSLDRADITQLMEENSYCTPIPPAPTQFPNREAVYPMGHSATLVPEMLHK